MPCLADDEAAAQSPWLFYIEALCAILLHLHGSVPRPPRPAFHCVFSTSIALPRCPRSTMDFYLPEEDVKPARLTAADWEAQRSTIEELYKRCELAELMQIMNDDYGFSAR